MTIERRTGVKLWGEFDLVMWSMISTAITCGDKYMDLFDRSFYYIN